MWGEEILPRIRQKFTGAIILSKTFKTFGLGEARVGEVVSPLLSSANPTLAVYAKADGIHLRLTAKAQSQPEAEEMITQGEASVRSILDEYIWGTDNETLEGLVGHLLAEKGLTLAVMESCSGGLLAATITDASGSPGYFRGGLVAGSDEALVACGVAPGLIAEYGMASSEMAQAMAGAARSSLGADIGISTTGVAGPTDIEGRPEGTVYIGMDDGNTRRAIRGKYPGDRSRVKRQATTAALFELKKMLTTLD